MTKTARIFLLPLLFALASQGSAQPVDFSAAAASAENLPRLRSLLIQHNGELVFENYYNGAGASRPANMKSASKSVISALVGIAIEEGFIESVDSKLADFLPEYFNSADYADKRQITVENLLTMQSGLETTSNRNYGRWVASRDWVRFAIDQPLVAQPGTDMLYSTGSTHLLSAILTRATGMDAKRFAERYLTRPMGFSLAYWPRDPQGIYFGGNDMEMTPRQMLAFGSLYLNNGKHGDTQVVPEAWVADSHKPRARSPRGQGRHYGYGWWLRDLAGMQVPVAWGYGGQLIFVVDSLDLVVVATSDSNPGPTRRGHLRRIYDLVEDHILMPLRFTSRPGS